MTQAGASTHCGTKYLQFQKIQQSDGRSGTVREHNHPDNLKMLTNETDNKQAPATPESRTIQCHYLCTKSHLSQTKIHTQTIERKQSSGETDEWHLQLPSHLPAPFPQLQTTDEQAQLSTTFHTLSSTEESNKVKTSQNGTHFISEGSVAGGFCGVCTRDSSSLRAQTYHTPAHLLTKLEKGNTRGQQPEKLLHAAHILRHNQQAQRRNPKSAHVRRGVSRRRDQTGLRTVAGRRQVRAVPPHRTRPCASLGPRTLVGTALHPTGLGQED